MPTIIAVLWLAAIWAGPGSLPGTLTPLLVTILILVLPVGAIPALTAAQRGLLRAMRGVDIPSPPAARWTTWRGLTVWLRAEATWRQLAYHALVASVLALAGLLMPFLWTAGVALAAIFGYVGLLRSFDIKFVEPGHTVVYGYLTVLGVLVLLAAPRVGHRPGAPGRDAHREPGGHGGRRGR